MDSTVDSFQNSHDVLKFFDPTKEHIAFFDSEGTFFFKIYVAIHFCPKEVATSKPNNLTFGKLLEKETNGKCLFEALFSGWKKASAEMKMEIKPVLYTNRKILDRRAGRIYNGTKYSA